MIHISHFVELLDEMEKIKELSDSEGLDKGNDPDGIEKTGENDDAPAEPNTKHEGPVTPLIESTADVELSSVALSPDQVSS